MKSKPAYESLSLDSSARRHLFIAEGDGLSCVARAVTCSGTAPIRVMCMGDGKALTSLVEIRRNTSLCVFDTADELTSAVTVDLVSGASMDTAVYVAGRERFLWDMYALLLREGVPGIRIRMEPAGSAARKVYCVHCSTMNDGVTDSIHVCEGCRSSLLVRDHFSRPMGAYMGVRVDAEAPGDIPSAQRLYA